MGDDEGQSGGPPVLLQIEDVEDTSVPPVLLHVGDVEVTQLRQSAQSCVMQICKVSCTGPRTSQTYNSHQSTESTSTYNTNLLTTETPCRERKHRHTVWNGLYGKF